MKDETGLVKYYKMSMDTRFIDVHNIKPLPELKVETLQSFGHDHEELIPLIEKIIPLDMFRFEGFCIASFKDVTSQQAIDNIRNIILNRSFDEASQYSHVIDSLSTLIGHNEIKFGLLPVLQVNDKLVFHDGTCLNSALIKAGKEQGVAEMFYLSLASNYFENPRLILFSEISETDESRQVFLTKTCRALMA